MLAKNITPKMDYRKSNNMKTIGVMINQDLATSFDKKLKQVSNKISKSTFLRALVINFVNQKDFIENKEYILCDMYDNFIILVDKEYNLYFAHSSLLRNSFKRDVHGHYIYSGEKMIPAQYSETKI